MPVYFIRAGYAGPVKVGHATNPRRRMTLLQTGNHEQLRIIRLVEGDAEVEALAHAEFWSDRIAREWFHFSEAMLTFGREIVAAAPPATSAFHGYLRADRGRTTRLAEALDIFPGAVSQWRQVPAERVLDVERITGLSRHILRPDIYGGA